MLQFVHLPLPLRFGHGPLARLPCGLDAVPPWARAGPGTHHDATAACPRFPRRLDVLRHARTAWLTCHAALAHTLHRAVFPAAAHRAVSHASHGVGTARTGRPSTKRRRRPCGSARRRPSHATAWGSGACRAGSLWSKRRGVAAVQACRWGWARRLPHPAAWHPTTPSGGPNASASKRSRHVFCARRGERARAPVWRPLPLGLQPWERPAEGCLPQHTLRHALRVASVSRQGPGPPPRGLPRGTRRGRPERREPVTGAGGPRRRDARGPGRWLRPAPQPVRLQRRPHVAHRVDTTAPPRRQGLGGPLTGTRQHARGPADTAGVRDPAFGSNCRRAASVKGRTERDGFLAHATPSMTREHRVILEKSNKP